jgi:hypothetical protein
MRDEMLTWRAVPMSRTSTLTPSSRQYPATKSTRSSSAVGWNDHPIRSRRPSLEMCPSARNSPMTRQKSASNGIDDGTNVPLLTVP